MNGTSVRKVAQQLGTSGIALVAAVLIYAAASMLNWKILMAFAALAMIVLGIWQAVRLVRFIVKHSLWSLRNRLLFVYALVGVLPIVLILVLVGLGAWAFMSELAVYLANSELDRRVNSIERAAQGFEGMPPDARSFASEKIIDSEQDQGLPGLVLEAKDRTGTHDYPARTAPLNPRPGWGNVHGLLFRAGEFYAWAHLTRDGEEVTALAPLPNKLVANLVPHLGEIAIFEGGRSAEKTASSSGSHSEGDTQIDNPDPNISFSSQDVPRHNGQIPPPANRFDIIVQGFTSCPHYDWSRPGQMHQGYLAVTSRPSAILQGFFSGTETFRGFLFVLVVVVAGLFLLVELVALAIGISLSARITAAVNQLYEGTRRVIKGDFEHRITVRNRDQLGDLAVSFNQMTGTIERLVCGRKRKGASPDRTRDRSRSAKQSLSQGCPAPLRPQADGSLRTGSYGLG